MKKNTKIVDPMNYPDYADGTNYNAKPKRACKKPCEKKEEGAIKLEINWGWQIEAAVYSVIANTILAIATLITLICK